MGGSAEFGGPENQHQARLAKTEAHLEEKSNRPILSLRNAERATLYFLEYCARLALRLPLTRGFHGGQPNFFGSWCRKKTADAVRPMLMTARQLPSLDPRVDTCTHLDGSRALHGDGPQAIFAWLVRVRRFDGA